LAPIPVQATIGSCGSNWVSIPHTPFHPNDPICASFAFLVLIGNSCPAIRIGNSCQALIAWQEDRKLAGTFPAFPVLSDRKVAGTFPIFKVAGTFPVFSNKERPGNRIPQNSRMD
jgi:hypothetical protein